MANICIPAGVAQAVAESATETSAASALASSDASNDSEIDSSVYHENESMQGEAITAQDSVPGAPSKESTTSTEESDANATRGGPVGSVGGLQDPPAPASQSANSSEFHATITSNMDSYSAGSTAIYSVRYSIDYGTLKEGDTVTVEIPKEVAEKARFSVDPTHFSSIKDNGDGDTRLKCGNNLVSTEELAARNQAEGCQKALTMPMRAAFRDSCAVS